MPLCTEEALSRGASETVVLDRQACTQCGDCASECDPQALEIVGREMSVDELLDVVGRDSAYYRASGGGMSLSGGEPLFQSRFAEQLLRSAKAQSLHCPDP
jgi:pyruvate formate lyase activating enzyme